MRVLVVVPYYHPKIGGLENYARQLNIALSTLYACEVVIVTSNPSFKKQQPQYIDSHKVYRLGTWFKLSNTPFNLLWGRQIRNIIRREQPDLIIAHAPVPSLADAAAKVKGKTPFVTVYHAATLLKQGSPIFNVLAKLYGLIGNQALKQADSIWAVSDYVRQQLAENLRKKALVLPNAVWAQEVRSREQISQPHFVFIASLEKSHTWKGLSQVLKAVAVCRHEKGLKLTLTVIGDGSAKTRYQEEALRLGIEKNVKFLGKLEGSRKTAELRKARALIVYPTTSNDAFPTVLLEAWSQYVPVIAASIGPLPFIVRDKVDGFLCPPSDANSLANMLVEISSANEQVLNSVASAAGQRTVLNYTWEEQARKAVEYAGVLV